MNIIFGKTQISLRQAPDAENRSYTKTRVLCVQKFKKTFGVGPRKAYWMLSSIGGPRNLGVNDFFSKHSILNREKKLGRAMYKSFLQFIGPDLKQVFSRRRLFSKQFNRIQNPSNVTLAKSRKKSKKGN